MTCQTLWVILCCLPEKGRKEIEEIVDRDRRDSRGDEREGQGRKRNRNESKTRAPPSGHYMPVASNKM